MVDFEFEVSHVHFSFDGANGSFSPHGIRVQSMYLECFKSALHPAVRNKNLYPTVSPIFGSSLTGGKAARYPGSDSRTRSNENRARCSPRRPAVPKKRRKKAEGDQADQETRQNGAGGNARFYFRSMNMKKRAATKQRCRMATCRASRTMVAVDGLLWFSGMRASMTLQAVMTELQNDAFSTRIQ